MKTERITENLAAAAGILQRGGLVAVPTETVYGLAGNGLDEQAVEKIYEVKGRPELKPLSLMVPDSAAMERYCRDVPAAAKTLAERFWPGPLTIVLPSRDLVPSIVRAGGETLGLRCPDHPLTLELLRLSGLPFAAPSANPSGAPSPKTAGQVLEYFDGRIDAVVDGGECGLGVESTILDMSRTPYRILRQGALPAVEIEDALVDAMTLVGITGGTGCGKTTALKELEKRGALILDGDAIYHELLSGGGALLRELEERFPGTVEDGQLVRPKLAEIVFHDEQALADLNRISHFHVKQTMRQRLRQHAMNGGTLAAIDAIELISSGVAAECDFTVGVIAETETRIRRIMARDGISRDYAEMRVKAQRPNSYFEEHCTHTIRNDGDRETFAQAFNTILEEHL